MKKESLRIKSVCVHEGAVWTVPTGTDGLYRIDLARRERECVCHVGYERENVWYFTCSDQNRIWGVSEQRKPVRIFSYEPKEKKLETYEAEGREDRSYIAVIYEGVIYSFFRQLSCGCLCFDTVKKEFYEESIWSDALKSRGIDGHIGSYFLEGGDIFFTLLDSSYLLHYNLKTKEIMLIDVGEKIRGIAVKDNIYYCLSASERAVIYFTPAAGDSGKRYGMPENAEPYIRIFKLGNRILLLGENELDYLSEEGEIRRCEASDKMARRYPSGSLYVANSSMVDNSSMEEMNCLFPYSADKLLVFAENGVLQGAYVLDFTEEEIRQRELHQLFGKGVVQEETEISVETLIEYAALQKPRVDGDTELPISF